MDCPTVTFFDPAIGGGQFVREIERRLRSYGHSNDNIRSRVFGFEYTQALVDMAVNMHELVGQYSKMEYEQILTLESDVKFDVIVGNPPYQSEKRTGTQPLWPLFVKTAHSWLSSDGYMAMITPNKWCGHTANVIKGNMRLYKDLIKSKLVKANIQECSKYFPGIGATANSFSYFIINNAGSDNATITSLDGEFNVLYTDFNYLPLRCQSKITASILKKVETPKSYGFKQVSVGFTNKNNCSVVISMAQRIHYDKLNIYYDKDAKFPATSKSTVSTKTFNNSSQEKVEAVFRSKLFRFIFKIYWNNDNFGTSFYNSLPYLDLNMLWTDSQIYNYFGLTPEEIEYIEANLTI